MLYLASVAHVQGARKLPGWFAVTRVTSQFLALDLRKCPAAFERVGIPLDAWI